MNLYAMLPFLEGWREFSAVETRTVEKDRFKPVFDKTVKGWLLGLDFVSDDAYAGMRGTYLHVTGIVTPYDLFLLGATLPPPHGAYLLQFLKPSVLSSAGYYVATLITSAYPKSIKGNVKLELGLLAASTQDTATAVVTILAVEIIDEKAFVKSVRKFKYGWLGWVFERLSRLPGLKYVGIPKEIIDVLEAIPKPPKLPAKKEVPR